MAGLLIATAIGGTALTGAAVASGIAGLSMAAGGVKSFSEANKAKKRQQKAEREAAKAMAEARRRTEVNVMEALSIKKEPYEQQVMALLTQGQAGLQAGVEGETRGAAATAGRVQMAQNLGQERVRTAMGQELQDIERAQVAEEARLMDMRAGLDLAEVEGYQQMAADAEKARAANIEQGITAFGNLATTSMENMPLYGFGGGLKNMPSDIAGEAAGLGLSEREYMKLNRQNQRALNKAGGAPQFGLGFDNSLGQSIFQDTDFSGVGGVNTIGSRIGTGAQLSPEQLEALRSRIIQDPNMFGGFPR
jgi:hypothetical protein